MILAAAALYVGLNALLLMLLSLNVSRARLRNQISLGDGGVEAVQRAIRAHGNAAEHMPMALLLIIATAAMGAPSAVVHGLGIALTIGRLSHAYALMGHGRFRFRQFGMLATHAVYLFGAIGLIGHALAP